MSTVESDVEENCVRKVSDATDSIRPVPEREPPGVVGIVIGSLVGFKDEGSTPLVVYPGQRGADAVAAATTMDLRGKHIGEQVTLMFESGDPRKPIVMGILRRSNGWAPLEDAGQMFVEADGERLIVTAKEQLVLRCGKASITLTKVGKVLVQGAYVSSRSSGVIRLKGGSVQIN